MLAKQVLVNAGLTDQQVLLIRSALGGKITMAGIQSELIAQHSRQHERERQGRSIGFEWPTGSGRRQRGKGGGHGMGYFSEEYPAEEYEHDPYDDLNAYPSEHFNYTNEENYNDWQDNGPGKEVDEGTLLSIFARVEALCVQVLHKSP